MTTASSTVFGTFAEADYSRPNRPGQQKEAELTTAFEPSGLVSGFVTQVTANFGTEGSQPRYRWMPIRWKPYVPFPHKQQYTPTPPGSFPARRIVRLDGSAGQRSQPAKARPVSFTPATTATIFSFQDDEF